jgi:hypothetical protein
LPRVSKDNPVRPLRGASGCLRMRPMERGFRTRHAVTRRHPTPAVRLPPNCQHRHGRFERHSSMTRKRHATRDRHRASVEAKCSVLTKTELSNHLLCLMKLLSAGDRMRTGVSCRGERRFAQPEARVERAGDFALFPSNNFLESEWVIADSNRKKFLSFPFSCVR